MSNRLAGETSPYLLQHRDNPVDWYPWGEEALSRARTEDRPILLSVGYSACHWCHVMEHESFSDPETAELMNRWFVNIKVDREERPDVDSLYMQAVQQMTGRGGWPMTVFLTPGGVPFYGGTYYPPEPRHGLPSFRQILEAIHDAYSNRRDEVEESGARLRSVLAEGMAVNPRPGQVSETLLDEAYRGIAARYDERLTGFGAAPKFPQPMVLDFLLLYGRRRDDERALEMVERTLSAMARGGIYDQIGGGFHRYSVDAHWLVPHFEKMLYDNALLARTYTRAHLATGRTEFRVIAREVLDYLIREMRHAEGAFFSSQDADSEGEEGTFYIWSAEEIDAVLGAEEGRVLRAWYGVEPGGNWEGKSILHRRREAAEIAEDLGMEERLVRERVARGRARLHEARSAREWPSRDDKVLTAWNAMVIRAFAEAGAAFDDSSYIDTAVRAATFVMSELRGEGGLLRSWRDGRAAAIPAFLEDHALLVDALVSLHTATFDVRWIREATTLADAMIDRFWSAEEGIFHDTPADGEQLVVRPRELHDNATPSGTSAAAEALLRLGRLVGEPRYERVAARVVEGLGEVASRIPLGFGNLLCALDHHLTPPAEVAIVGGDGARELLHVVRSRFAPHLAIAGARPDTLADAAAVLPLLEGREAIGGVGSAYVCQHFTCRQPVTNAADLGEELDRIGVTGTHRSAPDSAGL